MTKKSFSIFVATVCISSLITSCASNTTSETPNKKASVEMPKSGIHEPVELVFYTDTGMPEAEFNEKIGEPLKKKFPLLTPKYTKKGQGTAMQDLLTAGSAIDITWNSNFDAIIETNLAYDMTSLIKASQIDLNSFEPSIIELAKSMSDGKIYGLPVLMDNIVLYYNKDIFDKFGVPYLKNGMTWDEVLDIAKKLTVNDGTKQTAGLAVSHGHILRMNQLSQPYIDTNTEKVTFEHETWKKIIETTIITPANNDVYRQKLQQLGNRSLGTANFLNDKDVAMWAFLSNMYYANTPDVMDGLNWDMVALPSFKEKPRVGSQAQAYFFNVTAISKHKEQSVEVIKYLTSEEYQLAWAKKGALSPLKSDVIKQSYGKDSRYKDKNFSALYYNNYAPIPKRTPYNGLVEGALTKRTTDLAMGKVDINTALRSAAEEANKAIEAAKTAKAAKGQK